MVALNQLSIIQESDLQQHQTSHRLYMSVSILLSLCTTSQGRISCWPNLSEGPIYQKSQDNFVHFLFQGLFFHFLSQESSYPSSISRSFFLLLMPGTLFSSFIPGSLLFSCHPRVPLNIFYLRILQSTPIPASFLCNSHFQIPFSHFIFQDGTAVLLHSVSPTFNPKETLHIRQGRVLLPTSLLPILIRYTILYKYLS